MVPDEALEYAGLVLIHCAVIADSHREGELICPFAVLNDGDGRRIVDFESETQEEAVSKGWASLADAKSRSVAWAFGREGIYRDSDGKGTDVITVTFWLPGMTTHYSVQQLFGRAHDQGLYLLGEPTLLEHGDDLAELVTDWSEAALASGIASHPKGPRWSSWRPQ